ncbi:MAG: hypothetical protein ACRD3O_07675 [Terriglobia bacterium]
MRTSTTCNQTQPGLPFRALATRRRIPFLSVMPLVLAVALVWPFSSGNHVVMTNSQSVPSAKGVVDAGHDSNNNTTVDMKVQYLAQPSSLTPAEVVYVVWIQANGHPAENKGALEVGKNLDGQFKTVTPYKDFDVFVTAEQSPQVRSPDGNRVLSAHISR